MKKAILFLVSLMLLGAWTAFGYHEGVRAGLSKVPMVTSVDPDVKSLIGHELYCFAFDGGIEPCVIGAHNPNGPEVLLLPKSMTEEEPITPDQAPKEAPNQK